MAKQTIGIGAAPNDDTGDALRVAFDKTNDNFDELFLTGATNNQLIINVLADFPTPSGEVITLAAATFYLIGNSINAGNNRFILSQDTVIEGLDSSASTLSYTGTGDMFTAVDVANKITKITLDAPNGRLFNISSPAKTAVFQFIDSTVDSCDKVGIFTDLAAFQLTNVAYNDIKTDGHSFAGAFNIFTSQTNLSFVNGGSLFDLGTATFNAFDIDSSFVSLASGTKMLTATGSTNINVDNVGSATGTRIFGAGSSTPLSGISPDDIRWIFLGNDEIPDTNPEGLLSLNTNAVNTVISTIDTPVLVAGTWVIEGVSFFTGTTSGRLTYNGERDLSAPIDIVATIESDSGTNQDITTYLALNGTIIANSGKTNRVGANDPKNTTVLWQLTLTKDDFLEVFIENNTGTTDLLVIDAVLRIR